MPKFKNIPVLEMDLIQPENEGDVVGLYGTAFVSSTAVQKEMVAFNSHEGRSKIQGNTLRFSDDEQRMVYQPMLIPEQLIYRVDFGGYEECYVKATKNGIRDVLHQSRKLNTSIQFNYEHKEEDVANDVFVAEMWLTSKNSDKSKDIGFKNLPEGTLMFGVKVDNDETWERVKAGDFMGLSIEGWFGSKLVEMSKQKSKKSKILNMLQNKLILMAKKLGVSLEDIPYILSDGSEIILDTETGKVFAMVEGARGEMLPDGEYTLEDGTVWVVTDGKIPMETNEETDLSAETSYEIEGVGVVTESDGVLVNEAGEPLARGIYAYEGGQLVVTDNGFEVFESDESDESDNSDIEQTEQEAPATAEVTATLSAVLKENAKLKADMSKLRKQTGTTKLGGQKREVSNQKQLSKTDFINLLR